MTIQLHDTLRGKKVPFEPQKKGEVTMYLCGPTVYNYAHIGNARPAVVFDLLARVLRRHYKLTFARNITDVDDKINAASVETGKPIGEITEKYIKAYNDDMGALSVQPPDVEPRATKHIADMIEMIEALIEKGFVGHRWIVSIVGQTDRFGQPVGDQRSGRDHRLHRHDPNQQHIQRYRAVRASAERPRRDGQPDPEYVQAL